MAEERAAQVTAAKLLAEILQPSLTLEIVEQNKGIQIRDGAGRSRHFRTDGKRQKTQLLSGTVTTVTTWQGKALEQEFKIPSGPDVRIRYALEGDRLVVAVKRPYGGRDALSWTYERAQ